MGISRVRKPAVTGRLSTDLNALQRTKFGPRVSEQHPSSVVDPTFDLHVEFARSRSPIFAYDVWNTTVSR